MPEDGHRKYVAVTYFLVEMKALTLLLDVAADHGGYIPTRVARARGMAPGRLVTLAHRGALERIGHGLYRLPGFPVGQHDDLLRAVLWTNGRGAISNETALALHDLADVNPTAIDISVPADYRIGRAGAENYRVHRHLDERNTRTIEGVCVVDAMTAILGSMEQGVGHALISDAIDTARRLGWITRQQAEDARTQAHNVLCLQTT